MANKPTGESFDGHESLMAAVPGQPEDREVFRIAQLLVLLQVAQQRQKAVTSVDRLGIFDFLAANPYVAVSGDSDRDDDDRLALKIAGFSRHQLSYASTGPRFVSRRRRLQHDLSLLVAYGLISIGSGGYRMTETGATVAHQMSTVYADAYRVSAEIVIRRLSKLSDRKLAEQMRGWLGQSWLLVDLLDDVAETVVAERPRRRPR